MYGGVCDNVISWIEEMGSIRGLLYNELPEQSCTNGMVYDLACFWSHGVYIAGGTQCDYTTGINEKISKTSIQLYPNPATDKLTIVFNYSTTEATVEIRDIHGKLTERIPLKAGIPFTYNTAKLPRSTYAILLYINDELVENKKFVLIK